MSTDKWETKITKIEPNKILIHGYRLDELMGKISYPQMIYLLIKGELPSENIGRMLDIMLVSSVDHGVTPPSTLAALTSASTGAPINAAISAGVLSINDFHGGAIEKCMKTIVQIKKLSKDKNISLKEACVETAKSFREKKKRFSGFGHRIHTQDPRTVKLIDSAKSLGISGENVEVLLNIQQAIKETSGKDLPVNVDGALAGLLLEIGMPVELANTFFIMARIPGLVSHIYEEKTTQKPMRKINPSTYVYTGKEERSL